MALKLDLLLIILLLLILVDFRVSKPWGAAMATGPTFFDHEKLDVYQESITFIAWLSSLLEEAGRVGDVKDQLDRASTSITLNVAEGNGKYNAKDRCRFFDIAHGSALECAAGLDVLVAKQKLTSDQIRPGKETLQKIVRMLFGLIKRNSSRGYDKTTVSELP
jgi:four helix bundle protein